MISLLSRSKFGFLCPVAWGDRREYVIAGHAAQASMPNVRRLHSYNQAEINHTLRTSRHVRGDSIGKDMGASRNSGAPGRMTHYDLDTIVFYRGHLFVCENTRSAAKFRRSPEQYLRFQNAPGAPYSQMQSRQPGGPHAGTRSALAGLVEHIDRSSSLPIQLSPVELTSTQLRR